MTYETKADALESVFETANDAGAELNARCAPRCRG